MNPKIDLNVTRALETVKEIDDSTLRGKRPSVFVSDMEGLSPPFVKSLMQRDDIEVVLSEKAAAQFAADAVGDPATNLLAPILYAAAALAVLIVASAGMMLVQ